MLQSKGRNADAAAKFARVRSIAPNEFEGWYHGGMVALLAGNAREGVELLKRALELEPESNPIALSLGIAHVANGDATSAEFVLRRVAERQPKLPDVWRYLGMVYETQNRLEYARMARQNLVMLAPKFAAGWIDYGSTLSLMDRQTEALACFARALALEKNNVRARVGHAMVYLRCHRVVEAVTELQHALRSDPKDLLARSFYLMSLHYLPGIGREQLLAEHRAFGNTIGAPANTRWTNQLEPNRRLRVAFFSRDFCEHSVAYFLGPILDHLDPREFEVVLYYDNGQIDALTKRLQARAALWRPIVSQTDPTVEAMVRADAPDILVDLAGHTASNRLPLLGRRLAPVQVAYLGYPNTTGVQAIDYRLVDMLTDPEPDADDFATEKLVRFAPTAWAYRPPLDTPAVAPAPCAATGLVTFGSFNNFSKVTDEMLRLWSEILSRVAGARLLLKVGGFEQQAVREPVQHRLRAAGIAVDRVDVLPRTPDTVSHLAMYGRVDVALDTFPYHGTTTTCEALWMGVPVITMTGDRHASRVGLSLLTAVGHPEWVAASPDDYVNRAVELGRDQLRLAALRSALRDELSRSVLCDHPAQAARFGAALRECWRAWCARSPAQPVRTGTTSFHEPQEIAAHA